MDFNFSGSYTYNQKDILVKAVLDLIFSCEVTSMLDIGAGDLKTAKSYKESVKKYQAIEQDEKRAKKLLEANIPVINKKFPCEIEEKFDLVLSSHSIPEIISEYELFLHKAWSLVNNSGYLVIITFKGANDTLSKFECELMGKCEIYDGDKYNEMMRILNKLGQPKIKKIISTEKTANVNDLIDVICWSLKLEKNKWQDKIADKLQSEFKKGNELFFPHEHLFIILQK